MCTALQYRPARQDLRVLVIGQQRRVGSELLRHFHSSARLYAGILPGGTALDEGKGAHRDPDGRFIGFDRDQLLNRVFSRRNGADDHGLAEVLQNPGKKLRLTGSPAVDEGRGSVLRSKGLDSRFGRIFRIRTPRHEKRNDLLGRFQGSAFIVPQVEQKGCGSLVEQGPVSGFELCRRFTVKIPDPEDADRPGHPALDAYSRIGVGGELDRVVGIAPGERKHDFTVHPQLALESIECLGRHRFTVRCRHHIALLYP